MKNAHGGLGVKSISDLVLKEVYRKCETKNLTDKEISKYEMMEREVFEKYDNSNENEMNNKINKEVFVKNDFMTNANKMQR